MKLFIKKMKDAAVLPERKTNGSAGYDLCACIEEPLKIRPGDLVLVPTGIAMMLPAGFAGMIYSRSGLAVKHGIQVSNGVGVIDSDYRGEVQVGLYNAGRESYVVMPQERIAQLVVTQVFLPAIEVVDALAETDRGTKGFGSTGK